MCNLLPCCRAALFDLAKGSRGKVGQKYIIWYWVGFCVIALWGKSAHANLFA